MILFKKHNKNKKKLNNVQQKHKKIVIAREVFEEPDLELTEDLSPETLEAWTSLTFMQLLSAIEQDFSIKFKMMELLSLKTMGDIVQALSKH